LSPTPVGFLLGSYLDPKNRGDMLLRNFGISTKYSSASCLLLLLFVHDLFFNPEDGSIVFLRNSIITQTAVFFKVLFV
jgi:hypothetical protein